MSEKKNKISYRDLFFTFLKINSFTFGGGYTIVPVIRDEFVRGKELISEEEMLDLTALAQSGPGPMAINASILTGYRLRGPLGAIVSLSASALPCLVIITILYYIYDSVRDNALVNAAFSVMAGAISAVLVVTSWDMAKLAIKEHKIFGSLLFIAALLGEHFLNINAAIIILISGLVGLFVFSICKEAEVK